MAGTKKAKYTEQMPFVGTPTQRRYVEEEASREGLSMADVHRRALDDRYGLIDGEEPSGRTA